MKTERQRACPSCGNELSGAIEFCPVCMLRKGLAGGVESGESSFEEAVSPTPDHPAQRFEHYKLVTGEDGKPVELGRGAMGVTCDVSQIDGCIAHLLDRKIVQFGHNPRIRVGAYIQFALTQLHGARREHQALGVHCVEHIRRRNVSRLHQVVIQIDHHLTLLPTVWKRNHRSRNRDHLRPDKIQRQVIQLLFGETLTGESKLKNRYARSAEIDNFRRLNTRWQRSKRKLRSANHLRVRSIHARMRLKKDFNDGCTVIASGFYVLDIINESSEHFLVRRG
jgi:hypothetical protein